ncbi:MAG: hypothetical protein AAFX00_09770 [Pseudomonadota bacterium]
MVRRVFDMRKRKAGNAFPKYVRMELHPEDGVQSRQFRDLFRRVRKRQAPLTLKYMMAARQL